MKAKDMQHFLATKWSRSDEQYKNLNQDIGDWKSQLCKEQREKCAEHLRTIIISRDTKVDQSIILDTPEP